MTFYHATRYFIALALPMIVSNIFLPLVGLVDTAIVGHLPGSHYLAGVALGSIIITQLIWVCGFLRMAVTGLSAQSSAPEQKQESISVLGNGALLALLLGVLLWFLSPFLFQMGVYFSGSNTQVVAIAEDYFFIRISVAPVSLLNLVLIGWLLGRQQHKNVMKIQIIANLLNMLLSVFLAIGLAMETAGVAIATALSECLVLLMSLFTIAKFEAQWWRRFYIAKKSLQRLLRLNRDVFFRNLCLQIFLGIFTYLGLQQGQLTAATNAVLMQFFVLIALGLDGVAYAAEALLGEASGKNSKSKFRLWIKVSLLVSSVLAICYTLVFALGFRFITHLLTDITEVQEYIQQFKIYIVFLPLVAHWCFLLDGWYVGLTQARAMLLTMLLSAGVAVSWYALHFLSLNADILWQGFLLFLLARGILLGGHFYYRLYHRYHA
ncbi:MATE family efflux transporter [Planctobacterium marinum]|uniref:MATE family efflux transporter n=1 Tax=Planctobacterium marinum TaxID=1631968 RepID=A0AA48KQM8_9ALTE|nr:MATE family efflux transporter [Planctobacterium marinum]